MKKLLWPLLALCFLTACASGQTPENSAALAPTASTAPPEASETLTPPKSVVPLEPPEAITLLDADCSAMSLCRTMARCRVQIDFAPCDAQASTQSFELSATPSSNGAPIITLRQELAGKHGKPLYKLWEPKAQP